MTNNALEIPCKVDALSLTWSPKELLRLKELAKIGACVKKGHIQQIKQSSLERKLNKLEDKKNQDLSALENKFDTAAISAVVNEYKEACQQITREYESRRYKDLSPDSVRLLDNEVMARYELSQMLEGELEVDTSKNYSKTLDNLLDNIGVDLVDVLCCGEAERFIHRLNNVFTNETFIWTVKHNSSGRFNYQYSAQLYADGEAAGVIAWGGKNLGCYVSFMGTGCDALDLGRLHKEIKSVHGIKITRIDLAYDSYDGRYNIATARRFARRGGFNSGGRPSSYMYIESGNLGKQLDDKELFQEIHYVGKEKTKSTKTKSFKFVPSKGRSLYVGSRESGKLLRVYEKGKQLGYAKDKWTRWELELHNSQREIPLDAMIEPAKYLAGAYPALSFLSEEQCKIKTQNKTAKMSIDRIVSNHITQARKAINMMRNICDWSDSEIIDKFLDGLPPDVKASYPQRLKWTVREEMYLQPS